MGRWQFERLEPTDLSMPLVAESMRGWFEREPWGEVARCPSCSSPDKSEAVGRYGAFTEDGRCPECGAALEVFWTDERVLEYFQDAMSREGAAIYGMRDTDTGQVVAWTWVYAVATIPELADLGPAGTYVDTFGFTVGGAEMALEFFEWGHGQEVESGARYFIFRTHKNAEYIHQLTAQFGYRYLRPCQRESDRQYHILVPG